MSQLLPPIGAIAIVWTAALSLAVPLRAAPTAAEALFSARVRPLLKARCLACHGDDAKKLKGGLDLRSRATLMQGGDSGAPGIVAGRPEESPVYLAVTREHADWEPMPPKENDRLTPDDVRAIKDWIAGGAPWPDAAAAPAGLAPKEPWPAAGEGIRVQTTGGLSAEWTSRGYQPEDLWAYQPLRRPNAPAPAETSNGAWETGDAESGRRGETGVSPGSTLRFRKYPRLGDARAPANPSMRSRAKLAALHLAPAPRPIGARC